MFAVNPETMRKIDEYSISMLGISAELLMKNAGLSVYKILLPLLPEGKSGKVVILCGKGNNGGDGYVLAKLLIDDGIDVSCVNVFDSPPKSPEGRFYFNEYVSCGGNIFSDIQNAEKKLSECDIIADAIFGTGFTGEILSETNAGRIIKAANSSHAFRLAIDTPSGVDCSDGSIKSIAFSADITVTLVREKVGLCTYPAKEYCGKIIVADIGIPKRAVNAFSHDVYLADDELLNKYLPKRTVNSNKGTYGTLLMYCGSENMTGAAYLSCMAALRSGVGLCILSSTVDTIRILQNSLYEPVFLPFKNNCENAAEILLGKERKASAFLIGCGIGNTDAAKETVKALLKYAKSQIILDADGINAICGNTMILKEANVPPILTPHPLEFSRLTGFSVTEIINNRFSIAKSFAKEYNCILVLKGAATVTASPDGRVIINTTGNSGLSKGGSGDVLAGLISSLAAQGTEPLYAAALGAYLHGKAADSQLKSISETGFLPSDLPLEIGRHLP